MLQRLVQIPFNWFLVYGGRAVGFVQTGLRFEPVGRALTDEETRHLLKIFEGALDLSLIRLKIGDIGVFGASGAPFTHCNTIYIPKTYLPDPSDEANYKHVLRDLLAHEAVHVWQYQNGGADYMSESLFHQCWGIWQKKGRGWAYDFTRGIKEGKSWAELNPEQQAELIEQSFYQGLFENDDARFVYNDADLTDYAREAIKQLRKGAGAP
jgi:hypothetical protein